MAVQRSPFSKQTGSNKSDETTWEDLVKIGQTIKTNPIKDASGSGAATSSSVRKADFEKEKAELEKSLRTLKGRIARGGTGEQMYEKLSKAAEEIAAGKKEAEATNALNAVNIGKKLARRVLDPLGLTGAGGQVTEQVLGTPKRFIQSAVDYFAVTPLANAAQLATGKDWKDLKWDDPKQAWNRVFDPTWSILKEPDYQTGNKWVDRAAGLTTDIIADPYTYFGVGAAGYMGRAGREVLATKFATSSMRAKYAKEFADGVLDLDKIVRYGEWAIPKYIRDAEGVETGIRFAGNVIKGTDELAVGLKKGIADVRAPIGDFLYEKAPMLQAGLVPKSLKAGYEAGVGRGKGVGTNEVINKLAANSSQRYAKGQVVGEYRRSTKTAAGFLNPMRKTQGFDEVYSLVEEPALREAARNSGDPVKVALAETADQMEAWQKDLVGAVNAERRAYGEAFGVDVNEINILDDYIHHRITKDAKQWMLGGGSSSKGKLWKPADMTVDDITGEIGAARYRQLRAGEEFLGETLEKGTIREINDISRKKLGFNWFETDPLLIADSYAYSMAKARGRAAFARRMQDFGPEFIKPLIRGSIPDPELVARLEKSHKKLVALAGDLRNRVSIRTGDAKDFLTRARRTAQAVLDKNYSAQRRTQRELSKALDELDVLQRELFEAQKIAAGKSEQERGAFNTAMQALVSQRNRLRAAIARGEDARYVAAEELRKIYVQVFPNKKNIPDNPEVMAEEILRRGGFKTTRELSEAKSRERALIQQLEESAGSPELEEFRAGLMDELESVQEHISAFEKIADVRFEADYAPDGFVYATIDDLAPIDPNEALQPYKVLKPYRTEELSNPEAIAMVAPSQSEIIDMRNPEDFRQMFNEENAVGVVSNVMNDMGLNGDGFASAWQAYKKTGRIDDMFREMYPAQAALIERLDYYGMLPAEEGFVPHSFLASEFGREGELENLFVGVAHEAGEEGADQAGVQLMEEVFGGLSFFNDRQFILVPAQLVDGEDTLAFGDEAYALIAPTSWGRKMPKGGGRAAAADDIHLVKDSQFVQRILAGDYETASLEAMQTFDTVSDNLMQTELSLGARQSLEAEAAGATRRRAGLEGAATRRTRQAEKSAEEFRKSGTVTVVLDGKRTKLTSEQAKQRLVQADKQYEKAERQLERAIDTIQRELGIPNLLKRQAKLEDRVGTLFNQAEILKQWDETTGELYRNEVDNLSTLMKMRPSKKDAGMQSDIWMRNVSKSMESLGLLEPNERKAYERIVGIVHADETKLAWLDYMGIPASAQRLSDAQAGKIGGTIGKDTLEGWDEIAGMGVQVPQELISIWKPNVEKLMSDPNMMKKVLKGYDWYVRFFKTYATSSIGFSVRNAMSATFMNYVAGVDTRSIVDGAKAAMAIGKNPTKWLDEIADPAERGMWELAWKGTEATGRGFGDELAHPVIAKGVGEKIINNKYTRFFGRINENVERAVRLPMAIDSLRKGMDYDQMVERVTRYHFNYADLSGLDEVAMRFVPFWIWTSRNIPLQVANMVTRPSAYLTYDKIRDASPPDANLFMPSWLSSMQPIGLGGDKLLAFDLPFGRLEQSAKNLTSIEGLISQMSPAIKVPIETMVAGKQVGLGVPFTDKWEKARGIDKAVAHLGELLGGNISRREDGELMINPRWQYAINSILPPVAKAERLSGGILGGKANYADRVLPSLLNEFGIPYREVGPYERGEAINRQFELKDFAKILEREGKIRKEK